MRGSLGGKGSFETGLSLCWLETPSERKLTPMAHSVQSAESF